MSNPTLPKPHKNKSWWGEYINDRVRQKCPDGSYKEALEFAEKLKAARDKRQKSNFD